MSTFNTSNDAFNWDELSRYAAEKKLDYLAADSEEVFEVTAVEGWEGFTYDEVLELTKEETMWMTLCLLYRSAKEQGIKTFKLSVIEQEEIDEIPYYINEMPNGDKYLTFEI